MPRGNVGSGAQKKAKVGRPALGIGRTEAAKILGITNRGVMYLEQQGELVGIRDASGRIRFKLKDVRDLHNARREKQEPVAILDVSDEGSLVLNSDGQYDIAERTEELRFQQEMEMRERELAMREREVLAHETLARSLQKSLPRVADALERMSWTSVGNTAIQALPEATRQTLVSELASLLSNFTGGVSPAATDNDNNVPKDPPS